MYTKEQFSNVSLTLIVNEYKIKIKWIVDNLYWLFKTSIAYFKSVLVISRNTLFLPYILTITQDKHFFPLICKFSDA